MMVADWVRSRYKRFNTRAIKRRNLIDKLQTASRQLYMCLLCSYYTVILVFILFVNWSVWLNIGHISARVASVLYVGLFVAFLALNFMLPSFIFDRLLLRMVKNKNTDNRSA